MHYLIEHETRLTFERPIREHQCELRIAPRPNSQKVIDLEICATPKAEMRTHEDAWGNSVTWFGVVAAHDQLVTLMRARIETSMRNPFDFEPIDPQHERTWITEALCREPRLWDFVIHQSKATPALSSVNFDTPFPTLTAGRPLIESVQAAMAWVRAQFRYDPDATHVHSSLSDVLEARAGVCQDFAHLLIAIVRAWGVPARYAMGYLDPLSTPDAAERAAQATHAWAQILVPGAGWRGFDATNGLVVNETYITVAVGRDYADAAPQRGSFKGDAAGNPPEVRVKVVREG